MTALGTITIENRHGRSAAVIALGQAEDHLRWYYDVYRKQVLKRAVSKLNGYERGTKDPSDWSDSYFDFIQRAPELLSGLEEERNRALRENRANIERRVIRLLGTYDTVQQAEEATKWLKMKREPTLNAGWLNVHVVAIPQQLNLPDTDQ